MRNLSRLNVILTVWIVCLIGQTAHAAPAQQFEKKVSLETRSDTWRDAKPFDIAKDLPAKLRSASIQVVPRGAREKDADILIEYDESKGGEYITPFNSFGDKFGIRISITLTVLSAASGDTLLTLWAEESTPFSVSGKTLYQAALEEFRSDNNYRYAEHSVGGALGSTPPATIAEIGGVLEIGANAPDFVFFSPRTHQIISLRNDPVGRRFFSIHNPSLPPPVGERKFIGGPVLIYFWGPVTLPGPGGSTKPYCPGCPKIMDLMQSIHESFALDGLQIVGFAQNVPDADLKDAAQHYSHLVASCQPDLAKALGCTALPSWALLDREGKLNARSDTLFERDCIAGKVREVLKQGQSAGAQTSAPILSTAAKTPSGTPLPVEPDQSQVIATAGEKVGRDINKRDQPAKVGQASPATVDKAQGGKKEPAEATGDAPGGQEKSGMKTGGI